MAADASGLKAKAGSRYARAADAVAREIQAELRVRAPHKSYELRNSITVRAIQSGPTTFRIVMDAPVIQAATTNSGARPHVIRARRAKMMRFYWPKVGRVVYFRSVNHPGNKGTGWWDKVRDRHVAIMGGALRRL